MNDRKCLTTITRVGKPDVFHESQTRQMRDLTIEFAQDRYTFSELFSSFKAALTAERIVIEKIIVRIAQGEGR